MAQKLRDHCFRGYSKMCSCQAACLGCPNQLRGRLGHIRAELGCACWMQHGRPSTPLPTCLSPRLHHIPAPLLCVTQHRKRGPGPRAELPRKVVFVLSKWQKALFLQSDSLQPSKSLSRQREQTAMGFRKLLRYPWSPFCPSPGCHRPPCAVLILCT